MASVAFEISSCLIELQSKVSRLHLELHLDHSALILIKGNLCRAKLQPPFTFGPSSESLETILVSPEDVPFDQVCC